MKKWTWYKSMLWLLVVLYMGLAIGARLTPRNEIYPVFYWGLFCKTPDFEKKSYDLHLVRYGGRAFDPPLPIHEMPEDAVHGGKFTLKNYVNRWGKAHAKQSPEAEEMRLKMERSYLGPLEAEYRLVEETYNPIERAQGRVAGVRVVETFIKEKE
jgi:hypothetical protein